MAARPRNSDNEKRRSCIFVKSGRKIRRLVRTLAPNFENVTALAPR